jgi:hypothetical protein
MGLIAPVRRRNSATREEWRSHAETAIPRRPEGETLVTAIAAAVLGPVIGLGLAWLVGNRLAFKWELRRKYRELDVESLQEFYSLYGEFFALLKLWDSWKRRVDTQATDEAALQQILKRATDAEGRVEALLLKIASERKLGEPEQDILGAFRQGYQTLRESVREDRSVDWNYSNYEPYASFKALACAISNLLSADRPVRVERAAPESSIQAFRQITSNAYENPRPGRTGGSKPWVGVAEAQGLMTPPRFGRTTN